MKHVSPGDRAVGELYVFPSPKGGGSIEGLPWRCRCSTRREFPSLKSGGPIEAGCSRFQGSARPSSFHRRKAVAPLKLHRLCPGRVPSPRFHRRKAMAPLKHPSTGAPMMTSSASFHRRKAMAPIHISLAPGSGMAASYYHCQSSGYAHIRPFMTGLAVRTAWTWGRRRPPCPVGLRFSTQLLR